MKSTKKLLVLTLFLSIGIFAKEAKAQTRVGYGIRGGVNISNLNDTDANVDSHTGLMLGLYFDYAIANSPVLIQPEVLYTQKGFEQGNRTFRTDYIEIPVLARFNFITNSGLTPFVYFGPYIGFKVNTDYPERVVYFAQPAQAEGNGFDDGDINTTDFGVTVGGGLDFGRFDLGVRYDAGLTKISDDDNVDAKNGVFSVIAGIGF